MYLLYILSIYLIYLSNLSIFCPILSYPSLSYPIHLSIFVLSRSWLYSVNPTPYTNSSWFWHVLARSWAMSHQAAAARLDFQIHIQTSYLYLYMYIYIYDVYVCLCVHVSLQHIWPQKTSKKRHLHVKVVGCPRNSTRRLRSLKVDCGGSPLAQLPSLEIPKPWSFWKIREISHETTVWLREI